MKKIFALFALMLVCIGQAFAYDFEVGGIYYNKSGSEATVTSHYPKYSGSVVIPSNVTYNNVTYSVTKIDDSAFDGCNGLTSVTIPNSVTHIGDEAFAKCSGLTSITIPNSVRIIGNAAFSGCSGIEIVNIPASVEGIGNAPFYGCSSLAVISVSKDNDDYCTDNGVLMDINKTYIIQCPAKKSGNYEIPFSVSHVKMYAFYGCSQLSSISFAERPMGAIEKYAFYGCNGLTSIDIPYAYLGESAFEGCSNLSSASFDDRISEIPYCFFKDCKNLSSVALPDSLKTIEEQAFEGCNSLKSLTIPEGVTSIGGFAFNGSGLTSVIIPNSMTTLSYNAFCGCHNLKSVTIPNSVTSIGWYAFDDCWSLTSITIPNSVTTIGGYAFSDCGLSSIYNLSTVPQPITAETFYNHSSFLTVHVLEGFKDIYANADYWSRLKIVDDIPTIHIESFELDKPEYFIDDVNETITASIVNVLPAEATVKEVTWSSADPSIAYIGSKSGQIVGLQEGVTTITATAADGSGVTASAVVRVGEVYKYTVKANDPRMGSVTESGYYIPAISGDTGVTISAVPNEGYEFVRWDWEYYLDDEYRHASNSNCNCHCTPSVDVTITAIFQEKANTEVSGLANTIYLEPFSAVYGQTVEVSVRMKNSIAATGFQFNMYLPEGVSVVKDGDGFCDVSLSTARTTTIKTNTFDASTVSDGSLMVLAASTKNFTFSGNDGEVVRLKLAVSKDLPEGEYPIVFKNIEITDASGTPYRVAYLKTNMSVTSYRLGDVNADGSISVADFSAIASHIMENTPTGFVEQAADVNEDGYVTVSDLSSLVPIIIAESTGGASHSPKMKVRSKVKTDISGKDNIIYASDVTVAPGKDFTVSFNMKNLETAMTGFQYNVTLPEGITVCKDGDGFLEASLSTARTTTAKTNTFDASIVSDGTLMVLAASTKNFTFSGTDGEVVTVKMHADENLAAGTYDLSIDRIELTDDKGTPFRPGEAIVSAITVKAPQALSEVDFDFTDPASLGITPAAEVDDAVDITAPITKGAVTATVDGGVEVTIDDDAYILEIDRAGVLTLSTTAPGKIVKVEFGDDDDAYIDKLSATTGELDGFVWTGSEEEVVFEVADTRNAVADITTIKVWLEGGEAPSEDLTFTDGELYTATAAATYGKVTYTRTFDNTDWQALYVPFSMDYDEWSEKYDIAEINNFVEYDDDDNGVYDRTYLVVLKKTSGSTEANYPYLIRAKETGTHSLVLSDKTLEAAASNSIDCRSVKNEYTFTGTYTTVTDMYANQYWALSGGALNKANAAGVTLNPQRWYMALTSRTGASSTKSQSIRILVDGEEGIETPSNSPEGGEPVAYDLMGRMVSVKDNARGVNIVNGKKLIK